MFGLFDLIGEIRPSMMLTRQAVKAAKGWDREATREAGRHACRAARRRRAAVGEGDHRRAPERPGDPVVLATTTPFDLVEPLAELLGFDGVLATRYRVGPDGRYDGTFDGEFVWGKGKLAAVQDWAAANEVDVLDRSWAYSDSYYDLPLLGAVRRPVAVNPDPRLAAIAVLRRWPVQFLDVPPGVPKVLGVEPQTATFAFMRNELMPYVRFEVVGHRAPPRTTARRCSARTTAATSTRSRWATPPPAGAVRSGSSARRRCSTRRSWATSPGPWGASAWSAARAPTSRCSRRPTVSVPVRSWPSSRRARSREDVTSSSRVLEGKWGAARLAAEMADEGRPVPVIPMGLWGTEKVWPRNSRIPNVLNVFDPPTVQVRVGPPVDVGLHDPAADTEAIMAAIVDLLPPEARERHEPTAEELARTLPARLTHGVGLGPVPGLRRSGGPG